MSSLTSTQNTKKCDNEGPRLSGFRAIAGPASGVLSFIVSVYFAWFVFSRNIPQNVASWSMLLVLDVIGLWVAIKSGNNRPYLQIGWTTSALCILVAVLNTSHPVYWGNSETVALVLCSVTIFLWLTTSPKIALIMYVLAVYISFLPLAIDYWNIPQRETLWLWVSSVWIGLLAVYGAPRYDFTHTFVPWTSVLLNTLFAPLCIL
jgi:hypothetical protein